MEEEELQAQQVERDVVTEVMMPQVKTLYRYQGQGMGFAKGEVSRSVMSRLLSSLCW